MPFILAIINDFLCMTLGIKALLMTIATSMYQPASITPAVIPIIAVSTQLEFGMINWLKIAKKNNAILGFNSAIMNPSLRPLAKWGFAVEAKFFSKVILVPIVRYPIYPSKQAPKS